MTDAAGNAATDPGVMVSAVNAIAAKAMDAGAASPATGAVPGRTNFGAILGTAGIEGVGRVPAYLRPTHLRGKAFLQLSAPTMTVPDASGRRATAHIQVRARYFPDPDTMAMPEYIQGELQLTLDVNQISTQVGQVIDFDLRGKGVKVHLDVTWSSESLAGEQRNAIDQVIRNALATGFKPANATLPRNGVQHTQFATMIGAQPVVAALLKLRDPNPEDPSSADNVFIGDGDDFALAISSDYVIAKLNESLAGVDRGFGFDIPVRTKVGPFKVALATYHYDVTMAFHVELQEGRILLSIKGKGHCNDWPPDFDFDATQALGLDVVDDSVVVSVIGDVTLSVHIHGPLAGLSAFATAYGKPVVRARRDDMVRAAQPLINAMLNANQAMAKFLGSLNVDGAVLSYQSVEIHSDGIVLRGSLSVAPFPGPHAVAARRQAYAGTSPYQEYVALNSWVPGGRVDSFTWNYAGDPTPIIVDPHTFVYPYRHRGRLMSPLQAIAGIGARSALAVRAAGAPDAPAVEPVADGSGGAIVARPGQLCVTVRGTRLTSSGPVVDEAVQAQWCEMVFSRFAPSVDTSLLDGGAPGRAAIPVFRGTAGRSELTGYLSPWGGPATNATGPGCNLVVHFASPGDPSPNMSLALQKSGRLADSATGLVMVVPPGSLQAARTSGDVIVTDDPEGGWFKRFGIRKAPATVIVDAYGRLAWRHDGRLSTAALASALRERLQAGAHYRPEPIGSASQAGQAARDFFFAVGEGQTLSLRKLRGRSVGLVFWASWSPPSLRVLRDLESQLGQAPFAGMVVLAVNDGESEAVARKAFKAAGLERSILVIDPDREISAAYGINCWPTAITVDPDGSISDVQLGLPPPEQPSPAPRAVRAIRSGGEKRSKAASSELNG
jgi:peroxiredoxin